MSAKSFWKGERSSTSLVIKISIVSLFVLALVISFFLSFPDLFYNGEDIAFLFEEERFDFETNSWTGIIDTGIQSPYGISYFDFDDEDVNSIDYKDGFVFVERNIGGDLIVDSHNLIDSDNHRFNLTNSELIKTIPYGDWGAVLFKSKLTNETWVFYDRNRFGPYFGEIVDISSFDNNLFLEIETPEGRKLFNNNNIYNENHKTSFDIHQIGDSLGYIVGENETGESVLYLGKPFGDEYAEILNLYDAKKHLIYLARKDSGELVFVKRRIVNIFGFKLFLFKKEIPVSSGFDIDSEVYVAGSNIYYLECDDEKYCSVYKNAKIIKPYEHNVINIQESNDHVFFTAVIDGKRIPIYNDGLFFSFSEFETLIKVI